MKEEESEGGGNERGERENFVPERRHCLLAVFVSNVDSGGMGSMKERKKVRKKERNIRLGVVGS